MLSSFSHVWLFVTLWTKAHQAPPSMGFSRQENCSRLPSPPPGDLPNPGIKPVSLTSLAFAGGLFTTSSTWKALHECLEKHLWSRVFPRWVLREPGCVDVSGRRWHSLDFLFSSWLILFNIFSWACHMYILLDEIYVEIFCPWLFHGFFEAWEFFIIIENLRVLIIETWEFFMNLRYKSPIR